MRFMNLPKLERRYNIKGGKSLGQIGLQLWSIREDVEQDLLGMLEKVAAMGYSAVQFAGFFDHPAEEVKAKMDEVGIQAAGAHVQITDLEHHLDETVKYHETIGNHYLIVPYLPENMRTTAEDYQRTAALLNTIGEQLHESGFSLGYHNHDFEFTLFDGKTGFEILFENTDANHLKMELDCFWAAYTDNNPVDIIEKYAERCVSLHIKDMKVEGDQHISTELGTGKLPLADYIQQGKKHDVKWFVVEQEHFTKNPLESAAQNSTAISAIFDK